VRPNKICSGGICTSVSRFDAQLFRCDSLIYSEFSTIHQSSPHTLKLCCC